VISFQTILCAVDRSEYSRSTLQRAIDLGRVFHAAVTVMTVIREGDDEFERSPGMGADVDLDQAIGLWHEGAEERAVARLLAFARETTGAVPPRAIAVRGRIVPAILRTAQDVAADLVVVGLHGPPSGFTHLIVSPVTERIVAKAACAVLAVPRRLTDAADLSVRTIVCGVDRSASSKRALAHACVLAQQLDARLIVVHATEDLEEEDSAATVQAWYEQAVLTSVRPTQDARIQTPVGTAHAELLRIANEAGADLIVIGATGRRGAFGTTIRHVLRDARCDVLAVPASPR